MNSTKYKTTIGAAALNLILAFFAFGQTPNVKDIRPLSANQTIERELSGGQTHSYRITLKANELLRVKAEQKGVDVVVRLFDSNEKQLVEMNSPFGINFELLSFISEKAGDYKIQISALDVKAASGKYTLQWSVKNSTENDRLQINTETLFKDGLKLFQKNDKQAARECFNQALSIVRKLGNKAMEASLLSLLSLTYRGDEPQKQLEYLNQALSIWRNIGDKIQETFTLQQIGSLYAELGNHQKALEYLNQALSLNRDNNGRLSKQSDVVLLNSISSIYETSGNKQKALEYRKEAELLENQLNNNPDTPNKAFDSFLEKFTKAVELGGAGNYQKELEYLKQAESLASQIKIPHSWLLSFIGRAYLKLGEKERAFEYFNKALLKADAEKNRIQEAVVLSDFGDLYRKLGDTQKALDFYNRALLLNRASGEKTNEINTLNKISDFWFSIGNKQLAVIYGKQAVNVNQQFRSNIKELDKETQNNYLKTSEPIYRKLADILIAEGRFPEAQAVLDLLKEEEFKQIVRRNSGEPLYTLPYSKSEEDAIKIVDRLAALGRELSELKDKPKDSLTAAEIKRISEIESIEIPAANKALRQATEALSTIAPDVKNALDLKMKDNIQNILPALGKGVVALYTVVGKTSADETAENKSGNNNKITVGWILLVTPEIRKAYPIDTTDLEQTVFKLREALRSPKYDPQPLANELYKKLFLQTSPKQTRTLEQDLQETLGKHKDKTLMWSLDGVLRYVPMAALHDGKNYLVEKYRNVVFNTASLGSLKDSTKPNWEVVGLGVSTEGTVKAFDGRMLRFSALKGSETELNSIVKENNGRDTDGIFPGTLKINNEFTKEALFEGARTGKPVIHVSSHFWYNPVREETSFLLLGNGGRLEVTEFQDYPNLFSNVDFLSLSACDTATGGNANNSNAAVAGKAETDDNARQSNGKEIEGFAYIAQTLGAKSVMASLWQVSDEGTKELMLKFYQIKKEQPELPKGEALRQAQLSLLRGTLTAKGETEEGKDKRQKGLVEEASGEGLKPFVKDKNTPFSHPYYWSPFVLIGNWR